ncbi:MAG: PilN domain-containing protein [Clostridia bacterium]|nr:PilN domain-containing protein [Clostridia bacterium]
MDNKTVYRKDINLLDRVNDKVLKSNVKGMFAIIIAIIIVFIVLVAIFVPKLIVSSKQEELKSLENQLAINQNYEKEYNTLTESLKLSNEKLAELQSIDNGGVSKVLRWLESVVPSEGVSITTVEIKSDTEITIRGIADDEKTIADFFANVRNNVNALSIGVSGAEATESEDGSAEAMEFTMTIVYKFVD